MNKAERSKKHQQKAQTPITLDIGHDEIIIQNRYQVLGIINDFLIAVWFLIGSFLFLSADTTTTGTYLFILGSAQLLIRPIIGLTSYIHIQRIRGRQKNPHVAK